MKAKSKKIKDLVSSNLFIILISEIILFIYTGSYVKVFLEASIVTGWDGTQHYAIGKAFSDNIYPNLFGYLKNWYAGMPWPHFYPPLFTYFMAFFVHLMRLEYFFVFKYLQLVLLMLVPILSILISIKLGYKYLQRLAIGLLSVLFLVTPLNIGGGLGITMGGTFDNGLYPQFFSAIIFFLWLYVFLTRDKSNTHYLLSVILLSAAIVSNVHVAEPAILIFFVMYGIDYVYSANKKQLLKLCATNFLISLGLASFWLIPMLGYNQFFLTKTITNVPVNLGIFSIFVPLFFSVFGLVKAFSKKAKNLLGIYLSAYLIFLITVLPIFEFFPQLPLQPFRLFPLVIYLLLLGMPYGISYILELIRLPVKLTVLGYIILLLPMVLTYKPAHKILSKPYTIETELVDLIKQVSHLQDGRSVIEVVSEDVSNDYGVTWRKPTHFILSALISADTQHETLWGAFRESSISSPFIQPVRNSISMQHESYGVTCWLCDDVKNLRGYRAQEFYGQDISVHLDRLLNMGVKYVVAKSEYSKAMFELAKGKILKNSDFGPWSIYSIVGSHKLAEVLPVEPILVFADFKVKDRPAEGNDAYDWMRLNEEWLLQNISQETFVYSGFNDVTMFNKFDDFSRVLITREPASDLELNRIIELAQEKEVYLLVEQTPDIKYITDYFDKLPDKKIFVLYKTKDVRKDMEKFIKYVAAKPDKKSATDVLVETNNRNIAGIVEKAPPEGKKHKILVKYSYFPSLVDNGGGDIYLASPSFMLLVTEKNDFDIGYRYGLYEVLGILVSGLSVCYLVVFHCFGCRNVVRASS